MKELVSVCIPAYNNEDTIEDAIRSVLGQTYEAVEVVVVDDCSLDGTAAIVEKLQKEDGRVRFLRNEKNLGMVGNWNKCLWETRGSYVKLLCGDDILYPCSIEKEVRALQNNPDVNLVMSDTALIDMEGKQIGAFKRFPIKGRMEGGKLCRISLLINNFFGAPCNTMFRKSTAEKLCGFDEAFSYILDFDFWVRLAMTGYVYVIHETLNGFRVRDDSNTDQVMGTGKKGDLYVSEHRRLLERHQAALGYGRLYISLSVWWRKTRSRIIHYYLKIKRK